MGYMTTFELEWKPLTEVTHEPNCTHLNPPGAKFCSECGLPIGTVKIDNKIVAFLEQNNDTYYGFAPDGSSTGEVKWYSHEKDMVVLSKKFPTYLFTLTGEGEESGDLWREYYLNGLIQREDAQITYGEFDKSKLRRVKE